MEAVTAWRPPVPGIAEVFHAHFVDHAYPAHVHDAWTLLVLDAGAVAFALDGRPHHAACDEVTLLPPAVPHDGRAATPAGFRKRVLYLDPGVLDPALVPAAVARPSLADPRLRDRIDRLHRALGEPDPLAAESRLALVADRLRHHLAGPGRDRADPGRPGPAPDRPAAALAGALRDLLDAHTTTGLTLRRAADLLDAHPSQLVRAFTATFGLAPHRYLTGRRIALARRLLLAGLPVAEVAARAGFHDQSHLHRHFVRHVGTTPARYAAGRP
jgi:AraC-like DNA-binding protein